MASLLIKNAHIVNEEEVFEADVFIQDGIIRQISQGLRIIADQSFDLKGKYLLPGVIDDQVHFREPGLMHKGDLYTESRAAIAGGTTSFMEMPNTKPQALTQKLLEQKYERAAEVSTANYSFFMGAANDNLEEVLKTDPREVCGIKVFMGSSTGNMLVDDEKTLEQIFKEAPILVATHCEKEEVVQKNFAVYKQKYGDDIPVHFHPIIRSEEACYESSKQAISLAKKYDTRLHILHISTEKELALFRNDIPLAEKRVTAEVCVHHLWFTENDYADKGMRIKWNPAVKKASDRAALRRALLDGRLDILATDHAPHTKNEKAKPYTKSPSGGPMVQHALVTMLELYHQGIFSLEQIVEKMSHAPAICFQIEKRGFIREGYYADLVVVDLNDPWRVHPSNILYKCGWSPLEGTQFQSKILQTFVNGQLVYHQAKIDQSVRGMRLRFER